MRQVLPRKPVTGLKSSSSIEPASPSPANNIKSNFRTVPAGRATLMQKARHESTASTPAIARFHSRISTKSPGVKNDFLFSWLKFLLVRINLVIDRGRGNTHG
jgi:hypothetical protein